MSRLGGHKSIEKNKSTRIFIETDRGSSEESELDINQAAWRKRLERNYRAVYITIFCLSLEVPFKRYIFGGSLSLFLARLRFCSVVWIFIRLALFIALGDCEYAHLRAYLYDWTIYYPSDRRSNVQKIFIGGVVYHLCLKISIFHHKRKSFDPSLIDFLCSKPPPSEWQSHDARELDSVTDSGSIREVKFCNFLGGAKPVSGQHRQLGRSDKTSRKGSNFLRDRSHWFELSDLVWKAFKRNAFVVLTLCAFIMTSANLRLGFVYLSKSRKCDFEMPLLRQFGLLELNLLLVECTYTLIGSFSYCSMVKSDLMVQAQRVESYLTSLITDIKLNTNLIDHTMMPSRVSTRHSNEKDYTLQSGPPEQLNLTRRLASVSLPSDKTLLFSGLHSNKVQELIRKSENLARKTFKTTQKLNFLPLELADQDPECAQLYSSSRQADIQKPSQLLIGDQMFNLDATNNVLLNSIKELPGGQQEEKLATCRRLTSAIVEAQSKVILFLRCIDSYKPAISFVGNSFLLWMLTSISFVPLLIVSIRASPSEQVRDLSYAISSIIALSTGLVFTYIGATVHKRAVRLTSLLFRICSLYHSQAVAVRWNKIFMIWYSPNRCAFKVLGIFKLTHLNMLRAVSFLISGLTLVLNYVG